MRCKASSLSLLIHRYCINIEESIITNTAFIQARLSRRQLPRITQDGLVEYSLQIPASAIRQYGNVAKNNTEKTRNSLGGANSDLSPRQPLRKYGADIDWILSGRPTDCLPHNTALVIYLNSPILIFVVENTFCRS